MKRFLLACVLMLAAVPAFAQTVVSFSSQPGDWVGGGKTMAFSSANATLRFSGTRSAVHASISDNSGNYWNLDLVAPVGEELTTREYFYAERAPFVTGRSPGLEFTGAGRGCNKIAGSFSIRQIKFDNMGNLTRLEAVALQSCDGGPLLAIEARYRASYYMFGVDSAATHYVGYGRKMSYYNDTSTFGVSTPWSTPMVDYRASGMGDDWWVRIGVPAGATRFTKGTFYTLRFASGTMGMLDVSSNGRGCNQASGVVNVLEVVYGVHGIEKFYADFTHYCESTTRSGPALKGRIRYVWGQ